MASNNALTDNHGHVGAGSDVKMPQIGSKHKDKHKHQHHANEQVSGVRGTEKDQRASPRACSDEQREYGSAFTCACAIEDIRL